MSGCAVALPNIVAKLAKMFENHRHNMYKVSEAFRRLQNHVSILWLRHFCSETGLGSHMKSRSSMG